MSWERLAARYAETDSDRCSPQHLREWAQQVLAQSEPQQRAHLRAHFADLLFAVHWAAGTTERAWIDRGEDTDATDAYLDRRAAEQGECLVNRALDRLHQGFLVRLRELATVGTSTE